MHFRLRVPDETVAYLRHLHPVIRSKIRAALDVVVIQPTMGKPLRMDLAGLWSFRVGRLRIVYRVRDNQLDIIAVGPRSTVYAQLAGRREISS